MFSQLLSSAFCRANLRENDDFYRYYKPLCHLAEMRKQTRPSQHGDTGIAGLALFICAITVTRMFMLPAPRGKNGLTQSHVGLEDVIVMSTSTCILSHAGLWLNALCLIFGCKKETLQSSTSAMAEP